MRTAPPIAKPKFQDAAQGEAINGALAGWRSRVAPLQQALSQVLQDRVLAATQYFGGLLGGNFLRQFQALDGEAVTLDGWSIHREGIR